LDGHKRSSIDDLEKLANLKDRGVISEEEFALKKKQLLGL
jgi:transgelin